jgi:hypothetical protein
VNSTDAQAGTNQEAWFPAPQHNKLSCGHLHKPAPTKKGFRGVGVN